VTCLVATPGHGQVIVGMMRAVAKGKAVGERYEEGRVGRKALLRRGGWSYRRVMYSKGVLGTTRISVNYSKDNIKARKRLRSYLTDVLQAFESNAYSRH
jgi:hypothetical protein